MMETVLAWVKGLPTILSHALDIILIAIIFLTAFTLLVGIWLGFFVVRKRMNHILEIQFFPPRITFREKENNNK